MRRLGFRSALLLVFLCGAVSHAKTIWVADEGSKIDISIGYTLGTHRLSANRVTGELAQVEGHAEETKGELRVQLEDIKEGSSKLECHLREALGLEYSGSDFPEHHVCSSKNKLPDSGPGSMKFPEVKLVITGLEKSSGATYKVQGQWVIHGVSKNLEDLRLEVTTGDEGVAVVRGKTKFNLKDFGIVVKKAFVISVSDSAEVSFDVRFKKGQGTSGQ